MNHSDPLGMMLIDRWNLHEYIMTGVELLST